MKNEIQDVEERFLYESKNKVYIQLRAFHLCFYNLSLSSFFLSSIFSVFPQLGKTEYHPINKRLEEEDEQNRLNNQQPTQQLRLHI